MSPWRLQMLESQNKWFDILKKENTVLHFWLTYASVDASFWQVS